MLSNDQNVGLFDAVVAEIKTAAYTHAKEPAVPNDGRIRMQYPRALHIFSMGGVQGWHFNLVHLCDYYATVHKHRKLDPEDKDPEVGYERVVFQFVNLVGAFATVYEIIRAIGTGVRNTRSVNAVDMGPVVVKIKEGDIKPHHPIASAEDKLEKLLAQKGRPDDNAIIAYVMNYVSDYYSTVEEVFHMADVNSKGPKDPISLTRHTNHANFVNIGKFSEETVTLDELKGVMGKLKEKAMMLLKDKPVKDAGNHLALFETRDILKRYQ